MHAVRANSDAQVDVIVDDERSLITMAQFQQGFCLLPAQREAGGFVSVLYQRGAATQRQFGHLQQFLRIVPIRRDEIQASHAIAF